MVAKAKPNVVKTFDEWEMAWDIFMTVYSRKEENAPKLKSLIKYRSNVKDIHDRKGRWISPFLVGPIHVSLNNDYNKLFSSTCM